MGLPSSPAQQVRFGLKWVTGSLALTQAVRFLTTVVLARLLVPEMFGLVAMANVAIALIGLIREVGFGSAYIQRPDRDPVEARLTANTTFVLACAVNVSLFALAWLAAPWIASFFRSEAVQPVLRVLFVAFLLDAVGMTPNLMLQKRLEFGRHAVCEIGGSLANAAIAISLAVAGFGVWSLVAGQLGSQALQTALAFRLARWRPRAEFSPHIARELFAYGKYLWGFAILSAVGDSLDRVITGRWLGAASLGLYGVAFQLCKLPATQISNVVNRVTFPAFSRLQDDRPRLRRAFLKTLAHVAIVAIPLAVGLLAVAEELVLTLYGEPWAAAVPVVKVLAFYGLSLSMASISGPVFKAIGKPQVLLYTSVLHQSLLVGMLLWLGRYGIVGVASAVVVPIFVSLCLSYLLIVVYLEARTREVLAPMLRAGVPSLLMYAAVRLVAAGVGDALAGAPLLALEIACGGMVYLLFTGLLNREILVEFSGTVKEVIAAKGELV